MGEVWHAFDLKLRVDVALKALREDFFKSERRLELLRQEVRAAREVVSPNVCRIFDLIEIEGRELVSMEYVDGATLLGVLQERGPLELKEAQDIASQFLAGLEAIHKVGLIHRDIKPENIMLTRAGRVVVMDFGLARQDTEGGGSVSGTPAYMAPEQAAGQTVDARADVYAAGVVLAEMVSPDGIKSYESRQSVWEGVRSEPTRLPDSPWAPVLKRAVAKNREGRFNTARTLTRALEDVTLRVEGAEDLHPYPGLASFTESDAEYFFGREAEVEQMWRKLDRPHLLGILGPSGAGKSSFIRAGVIPNAASGWGIVTVNPGNAAFRSLRQELASELAGDADALRELVDVEDLDATVSATSRWRQRHEHALLIVDQFEELFTQNPIEVQTRFTELLGRLVLEADVFVLLSMRDDFFFHCHQYEALNPVVTDLTLLGPPTGAALRRALVQPAMKCGYRFEDEDLVDEMLAEVEGERGALPLLAFAAARLWEKRDRETGLLTREAYQDIGGVGGALAQHAEATIDRIGVERIPIVRELFRNLVTAEGTRAIREWDELLSVFDSRDVSREEINPSPAKEMSSAEEILHTLIDARLLTSYEVREDEHEPIRRVEIIHESLLANWPRLVRWQTQDADAVQLRDQLRQAARTWDEQGRSDDTLWTGAAFREFASWQERYPGGLTEIEKAFASAMTTLAGRLRRRRRIAVTATLALLLAGLAVVGSFWQRSVRETRRAEAQKLIAFGQLELEKSPSAVVAHAIASLELSDTPEARLLALEALWKGPTALVVNEDDSFTPTFSADGGWLVQSAWEPSSLVRIVRADGSTKILERVPEAKYIHHLLSPESDIVLTWDWHSNPSPQRIGIWAVPEGRRLAEVRYENAVILRVLGWDKRRVLLAIVENDRTSIDAVSIDGTRERLGTMDYDLGPLRRFNWDELKCRGLGVVVNNEVLVFDIGQHSLSEPRRLGRQEGSNFRTAFDPLGRYLATSNQEGEIRLWNPTGATPPTTLEGPLGIRQLYFTGDGSLLKADFREDGREKAWMWSVSDGEPRLLRRFDLGDEAPATFRSIDPVGGRLVRVDLDRKIRLWPFSTPADAEPLIFGRDEGGQLALPAFDHQGRWLATTSPSGLTLYPLGRSYPSVIRPGGKKVRYVVFGPEGRWLASGEEHEAVRIWPLDGEVPTAGHSLSEDGSVIAIAVSPDGEHILAGTTKGKEPGDLLLSLDGSTRKVLTGFRHYTTGVAFSPDGSLAAGAGGSWADDERVIRVWDVASGAELMVLVPEAHFFDRSIQFTADNRLLSIGRDGLRRWNIDTGQSKLLFQEPVSRLSLSDDGRRALLKTWTIGMTDQRAVVLDLETGVTTPLETHGAHVITVALDEAGTIVATGDRDGVIRVGPITGKEPHLLLGHESTVLALAFDPLGRWIASGGNDGTIRLWPMPDLSKPPLHTLPREELIAKLKTLTNLRVVRDPDSPTGWTLTHDPFPGWETVPTW